MNLFTRFLSRHNQDSGLEQLIAHWDQLEILVITVFKGKLATEEDERVYALNRAWWHEQYPRWSADLQPLWRETLAGGQMTQVDPFLRVVRAEKAADLVGDWGAMQHLAAAREALNRYLLRR